MNKFITGIIADNTWINPISLVTGLVILGMVPLDVMLPSFPALAQHFGIKVQDVALSISIFAIGFALAQLFTGPLSDVHGRKPILIGGLAIALIGSFGCTLTDKYEYFLFWRLIQSIGASCFVLAQAIVQDTFEGSASTQARIYITTLSGVLISCSPLFGVLLQTSLGWQGSFYFFIAVALFLLIHSLVTFKETARKNRGTALEYTSIYLRIFRTMEFIGYNVIGALAFACHFSFITASPHIFLEKIGFNMEQYGFVMLFYGAAYILGGTLATKLSKKISLERQILVGSGFILCAGITMIILDACISSKVVSILLPMLLCTAGATLIRPAAATKGMDLFRTTAGTASAASSTIRFLVGGIVSAGVSVIGENTVTNLYVTLLMTCAISVAILYFLSRENKEKPLAG